LIDELVRRRGIVVRQGGDDEASVRARDSIEKAFERVVRRRRKRGVSADDERDALRGVMQTLMLDNDVVGERWSSSVVDVVAPVATLPTTRASAPTTSTSAGDVPFDQSRAAHDAVIAMWRAPRMPAPLTVTSESSGIVTARDIETVECVTAWGCCLHRCMRVDHAASTLGCIAYCVVCTGTRVLTCGEVCALVF
jgi:hypothetical protein